MEDILTVKGRLEVIVYGPNGDVKHRFYINNLVVNSGLVFIAQRMVGESVDVVSHMALGEGNSVPTLSQTSLDTEQQREVLNGIVRTGASIKFSCEFPAIAQDIVVSEAGLFNNSVGGVMVCRTSFPSISKTTEDVVIVNWTLTFAG